MKTTHKLILLIIINVIQTTAFAQGWSKKQGEGYFKIAQNIITSDKYFAPDGSTVNLITIGQFGSSIYGEYGFTNKITGLINAPVYVKQTINNVKFRQSGKTIPGDEYGGIGDADIGLKYGFLQNKPIVISASFILGLPFGQVGKGETGILQTGDGEFNQIVKVDVSKSFYPKPIYVSAYSGFNNRTKNFSDELRYGFEIGFPLKKFIPIIKVNGIASLKNGGTTTSQGSLFANNIEYLSPSLDLNYQLTSNLGISSALATALFGKNVLKGLNYNFGLFFTI